MTPALLKPLIIEIDSAILETNQTQGPPRIMSAKKDIHKNKFITKELQFNVIKPPNAR